MEADPLRNFSLMLIAAYLATLLIGFPPRRPAQALPAVSGAQEQPQAQR